MGAFSLPPKTLSANKMAVLWISVIFLGTFCAAQNSVFSQSIVGDSPFTTGGTASVGGNQLTQFPGTLPSSASGSASAGPSGVSGSQFNQLPGTLSSSVSGSVSAGPSGTSASASASTSIATPQPYPACLSSNPVDAVSSPSPFAYALLEGSFTNPLLRTFYNTSFITAGFYDAIYDEVKETLPKDKSQLLAGSLALLFEIAFPRITPLLNAVSITNALNEILGEESIVISDDKEDYIEPFLMSISKAVSVSDGSVDSQTRAVVSGLLNYLDYANVMSYSKLHEFINILAGEYYLATYSTCKPSSYDTIPKP